MKLQSLTVNDNEFSLSFVAKGKEMKDLCTLFKELEAVALMVNESSVFHVSVTDGVAPIVHQMGRKASPERAVEYESRVPKTEAEHFVDTLMQVIEFRGDWIDNPGAAEPRLERTIACPFYVEGKLRTELELWRKLIEDQTKGVENPALAAVAILTKKAHDLAENRQERDEKKEEAIRQAKELLKDTARKFFAGTMNEHEEPVSEGALNE